MQVPANLGQVRDRLDQLVGHLVRIDGAEANALDSRRVVDHAQDTGQVHLAFKVHAVGTQVNAGQNDLLIPRLSEESHLLHYVLRTTAAVAASGPRDLAKGAELVAPVLDLEHGPGAALEREHRQFLELPYLENLVHDGAHGPLRPADLFHQVDDLAAPVRAYDDVHAGNGCHLVGSVLRITTHRDDNGRRIAFYRAPNHLTRLPRAHIRHAAGVDDVHLGILVEGNDLIARADE